MKFISNLFNFDDIGTKIKNLAKWSCWITILLIWICAPISLCILAAVGGLDFFWIPLVAAIVGPVIIWTSMWLLYAFGEFVEDIHNMRNNDLNDLDESKNPNTKSKKDCNNVTNEMLAKAEKDYKNQQKNNHAQGKKMSKSDSNSTEYSIMQVKCPKCGVQHDFDYPKCPNCNHKY